MIFAGSGFGDFGGPVEEMRNVGKQVLANIKRAEAGATRRDCSTATRELLAAQKGYGQIKALRQSAGLPATDAVTNAMLTRMANTSLIAKSRCR